MKRSRWMLVGVLVLLLAVASAAGFAAFAPRNRGEVRTVSVIVSNSSSDRWTAFREGLNQGAEEFGVSVNLISSGPISDASEEAAIVRREIESGIFGIIAEPCGPDGNAALHDALEGVPAVFVSADCWEDETVRCVMPDYAAIGRAVAEALLAEDDGGTRLRVGVISGNKKQPAEARCIEAFTERMTQAGREVDWVLQESGVDDGAALRKQLTERPVDLLAVLGDDGMTLAAEYLSSENAPDCVLAGIGRSPRNIYYLDAGLISAMAVVDEFYMGYLSVRALCEEAGLVSEAGYASGSGEGEQAVGFALVTAETLHDSASEGIVFPIVR